MKIKITETERLHVIEHIVCTIGEEEYTGTVEISEEDGIEYHLYDASGKIVELTEEQGDLFLDTFYDC